MTNEQLIKKAEEEYPLHFGGKLLANLYNINEMAQSEQSAYIKGYNACQSDNKDDAIGFARWLKNGTYCMGDEMGKPKSYEELYDDYQQSKTKTDEQD